MVLIKLFFAKVASTQLQKFKNTALFSRLVLPSTLIHHENGAFRKRFSKPEEFEKGWLRILVWTEAILKTEFFDDVLVDFSDRVVRKHKSKMTGNCLSFLNSPVVMCMENTDAFSVFKFFRSCVINAWTVKLKSTQILSGWQRCKSEFITNKCSYPGVHVLMK